MGAAGSFSSKACEFWRCREVWCACKQALPLTGQLQGCGGCPSEAAPRVLPPSGRVLLGSRAACWGGRAVCCSSPPRVLTGTVLKGDNAASGAMGRVQAGCRLSPLQVLLFIFCWMLSRENCHLASVSLLYTGENKCCLRRHWKCEICQLSFSIGCVSGPFFLQPGRSVLTWAASSSLA